MRRAKAGHCDSTLLLAQLQTAGRGRQGRVWVSEPGQALTFSMGFLYNPQDWMGLSLAIGVALVKAIDPSETLQIGLKWPNDVWHIGAVGPAKLAGILIETVSVSNPLGDSATRYCVLGIGLNRFTPNLSKFEGFYPPPIGLLELGCSMGEDELLERILAELTPTLLQFQTEGFRPFKASFDRLDLLKNREINVNAAPYGVALGVNDRGELQVNTSLGLQSMVSQEVSVRPAPLRSES
jgi:BirA family biotin operon repressor/biotin-[acetyl-CoA-carboxylase] ligase